MLINLHVELSDDASVTDIIDALHKAAVTVRPYMRALGRVLEVDESINLRDDMLPRVYDASVNRSA